MMHSCEEGYQIAMYSCTHNMNIVGEFIIHKNHVTKFILAKNMTIIWDKAALHSASKSREHVTTYNVIAAKDYKRLLVNVWELDKINSRKLRRKSIL